MLTDEEQNILEIESFNDLLILIILDKDDGPDASGQPTIKGSLNSPLLINIKKKIGIQKLLGAVQQSITLTEKNSEIEVSEV
jgi:flagellar assembly factor FliW